MLHACKMRLLPRTLLFVILSDPLRTVHPERTIFSVILSDARASVATERESKDLCIASLPRWHQGILTVHSVPETICLIV